MTQNLWKQSRFHAQQLQWTLINFWVSHTHKHLPMTWSIQAYQHLWVRSNSVYQLWQQLLSPSSEPPLFLSLPLYFSVIFSFFWHTPTLIWHRLRLLRNCISTWSVSVCWLLSAHCCPSLPECAHLQYVSKCSYNTACSLQHAVRFYMH